MFIEFGGQRHRAFEWVRTRELEEIEDNKVTIVGTDVEAEVQKGRQDAPCYCN